MLARRMAPATVEKLNKLAPRLAELKAMAERKELSVQQLAIAWVLAQGDDILALVGSRTVEQLNSNLQTIDISLSKDDLQYIEQIIPKEDASVSSMLEMNIDKNGLFIRSGTNF